MSWQFWRRPQRREKVVADETAFLERLAKHAKKGPHSLTLKQRIGVHDELPILRCGDNVVGYLMLTGGDNFHMIGRFWPGPAYALYSERIEAVWHDSQSGCPDWTDVLEEVNDLQLTYQTSTKSSPIRDFQLDSIDGLDQPHGVGVQFKFDQSRPHRTVTGE